MNLKDEPDRAVFLQAMLNIDFVGERLTSSSTPPGRMKIQCVIHTTKLCAADAVQTQMSLYDYIYGLLNWREMESLCLRNLSKKREMRHVLASESEPAHRA